MILEGTEKGALQKGLWQLSQSKDIDIVRYPSIFSILREMFVRIVGSFPLLPQYFDDSFQICGKDCHCSLHFHA